MAVIGIAGALYTWFFIYNKPHPDYEKLEAEYHFDSEALFMEYRADKTLADNKYTGRMISLDGQVDYIESGPGYSIVVFVFDNGIFGDEGVRCTLLDNYKGKADVLEPGTDVNIKGFCAGYNETDVIIEKCTLQII